MGPQESLARGQKSLNRDKKKTKLVKNGERETERGGESDNAERAKRAVREKQKRINCGEGNNTHCERRN